MADDANQDPSLDVAILLHECLFDRRDEFEDRFDKSGQESLWLAFDEIERYATQLLTTGQFPPGVAESLAAFSPGDSTVFKVKQLLEYDIVRGRVQFEVAARAVDRLLGLEERIGIAILAAVAVLHAAKPSQIASKYLERVTSLYLAGYDSEVAIMAGAVLEAAMAARFPNSALSNTGIRPVYSRNKEYSLGQRMAYEKNHPVLTEDQRLMAWKLINARNDAVHVHPEAPTVTATDALVMSAILLAALLPAEG